MRKEVKKYSLRKLSIGCVSCLVGAMVIFAPKASAETPEDNSGSVFRSVPNDSKSIVYVRDLSEENTTTAEDGSESNPYKDFSRALDAVSDNGTITLVSDVVWQGGSDLVINKNITIDGRNNELAIRGTDLVFDANITLKDINISSRRDGATNTQSIYTGNNTVVFDNVRTSGLDRPNLVVGTKNSSDTDTSSNVTLRNSTVETKFEKIIVGGNRPADHSVTIDDKVSSIHGISIQNKGQNYTVTSNSTSISRVESDSNQAGTVVLNKDVPNITVANVNTLTIAGNISSDIITDVKRLDIPGRLTTSKELSVDTISGFGTLTVPIIENAISAPTISNDLTVNLSSNQDISPNIDRNIIRTNSAIEPNLMVDTYSLEKKADGYYLKQDQKLIYIELFKDLNGNNMLDDDETENNFDEAILGTLENITFIDNSMNSYLEIVNKKMAEDSVYNGFVLKENSPFVLIDRNGQTVGFSVLVQPKPEDNGKSTIKYKVLDFEGKELIGLTTIGEVDKNTAFKHNKTDIARLPENYELNNYDDVSTIENVTDDEYVIIYRADLIGSETVVSDSIVSDSFTTQYTTNTDEAKGYEKVVQEGKDELTQTTTVYKTKNGERTDEEVSSESVVTQKMQPKIIEKGVKEDISKTEDLPLVYELDATREKDTPDETVTGTPKRISEIYHWAIDDAGNYTTKALVSSKVVENGTNPVVKKGGKEERKSTEIPFTSHEIPRNDKPKGYRNISVIGKNGLRTEVTTYSIDRNTGEVTSDTTIEVVDAINEEVEVGIYEVVNNAKSVIKYKVLDFENKELIGLTTIGEVDKNTSFTHDRSAIILPKVDKGEYVLNNYDEASSISNIVEDEYVITYKADLIGSETVVSDSIVSDSFTTQYTTNVNKVKGDEKVVQEGQDELTQTTTVYKTKNGKRTDEEISSESVVTQKMQPKIIEKGVKEDISKTEDLPPVYELDTTRGKETPDETVSGTPKRISETYHWSIDDAGNYTTNKMVSSKVVEDGTNPVVKKGGKEEQYTEELEFNKRTIENPDKPEGYRHVTPGKKGLKTVITSYVIDRQTGVVTSNVREEIQPPIDEIVEVGTLKENLVPQPTPQPNPELEKGTSPSTYPTVDEKPKAELGTSPSTYPTVDEKPKAELGTSPSTYPTVDEKPTAELGTSPSVYPTVDEKPKAELGTSLSVYPTMDEKPTAELGTSPSVYPTVAEKPKAELGTSLSVYPTMAEKPTAELGTSPSVYPTVDEKPKAELGTSPSTYPTVDEKPTAELGTIVVEQSKSEELTSSKLEKKSQGLTEVHDNDVKTQDSTRSTSQSTRLPKTGDSSIGLASSMLFLTSALSLFKFGRDKAKKQGR
ncbi:G5 domain-containing protein [Streptococcus fryi]